MQRRTVVLSLLLLLLMLGACQPIPDAWTPGAFLGNFVGHVLPQDGIPVGLRVETQLVEKTEFYYSFVGQAYLGDARYRVEGLEESNGRVHYLAAPPPTGTISATFFDEDDRPRYTLWLMFIYGSTWNPDKTFEGTLMHEEVIIGPVRLDSRHVP